METLILFLSIRGRINFLQLARYGKYKEQRYRQQFEKRFDFLAFNKELTFISMDPNDVMLYYHSRFQIEFLYRDGKQHTGLNDSQTRSENKLHFQFNASLTSINIAKGIHWLSIPKKERGAFSMANIKTMNHNILMLNRFFDVFGI